MARTKKPTKKISNSFRPPVVDQQDDEEDYGPLASLSSSGIGEGKFSYSLYHDLREQL